MDPHPDGDTLARLALGERVDDHLATHLAECASCRLDAARLREVVSAVEDVAGDPELLDEVTRPAGKDAWARVLAGIDAGDVHAGEAGEADDVAPSEGSEGADAADGPGAAVTDLAGWSATRRLGPMLAAAAVAAVLGFLAGVAVPGGPGSTVPGAGDEVVLDNLDGGEPVVARIVSDGDHQRLVIDADLPALEGAFYAVWLLDSTGSPAVALGPLRGEGQELPQDVDLTAFPIIDVSREPFDGDAGHSGDSALRGQVDAST